MVFLLNTSLPHQGWLTDKDNMLFMTLKYLFVFCFENSTNCLTVTINKLTSAVAYDVQLFCINFDVFSKYEWKVCKTRVKVILASIKTQIV